MYSVLTFCSGYTYETYKRFVGSLFDTGFSGNVYYFIREGDEKNLQRLQDEYKMHSIYYKICTPKFHIMTYRYCIYFDFLMKTDIDSQHIFICDSRDVLFQKNIEDYPYPKGVELYLFQEEGKTIGSCKFNSRWIVLKDRELFKKIRGKPIICSGTTLGTRDGILQYLKVMIKNILDDDNAMKGQIYRDQCIHNYIIYTDQLSAIKTIYLTNEDNLVNTVGHGFKGINGGKIVNVRQEISWIVHQYDRLSSEFKKAISTKYNFTRH